MIGFGHSNEMSEEEKLIRMYILVHGKTGRIYDVKTYTGDDCYTPIGVNLTKVSDCGTRDIICSTYTREELLFDYITKDWEHRDELGRSLQHDGDI